MERIKDISKMKLQLGSVLIKIKLKGGVILAPEGNTPKPMVDYAEVVALSKDITDLSIGDIVLDFRTAEGFDWKNDKYAVIPRMNVKVAVDKEDFDFGIKVDKRKLN
jgi:hypothetical protein